MSRTIRKDINGLKFTEGRYSEKVRHQCRCWYCTGGDRVGVKEKIANKEMLLEIREAA
jgi:hypothetical protein